MTRRNSKGPSRDERVKARMFERSPMVNLVLDPDYQRGIVEWLWAEEVRTGGGVSRYIEGSPQFNDDAQKWLRETPMERNARWATSVPGDPRNGTLARILSRSGGQTAIVTTFTRWVGDQHRTLREQGLDEDAIAEKMAELAPSAGNAQQWRAAFEAMEPMVKEHNALHEEVTLKEDVVERLREQDPQREVDDPVARLQAELAAAPDDPTRARLQAELEHAVNVRAVRERELGNRRSLDEKVRAAYDEHAQREEATYAALSRDPRPKGRRMIQAAYDAGRIDENEAARLYNALEDAAYERGFVPEAHPHYGSTLDKHVTRAYDLAAAEASMAEGKLPEPIREHAYVMPERLERKAAAGEPVQYERAKGYSSKGLHEAAARAYDRAAATEGAVQDVMRNVDRAAGVEKSAPPKGSDIRAHVEAAYDKAEQLQSFSHDVAAGLASGDGNDEG